MHNVLIITSYIFIVYFLFVTTHEFFISFVVNFKSYRSIVEK